jgi:hypothetical protein
MTLSREQSAAERFAGAIILDPMIGRNEAEP